LAAKRKEEAELKEKLLLEEQNKLLEEAAEIKEKKMKEKIELENLKKMQLEAESETWEDNQAQVFFFFEILNSSHLNLCCCRCCADVSVP
jgi:hypothetical protein